MSSKRGTYSKVSAKSRAEIAKYEAKHGVATKHGVVATAHHFCTENIVKNHDKHLLESDGGHIVLTRDRTKKFLIIPFKIG